MAIANLVVAVRTTGANSLRALGRQFTAQHRVVSSVAGAYRDANGVWRQANGALLLQRHTVTQNVTALGRLANAARAAGRTARTMGRSLATAGSGLSAHTQAILTAVIGGIAAAGPAIGAALQGAIIAGLGGVGLAGAIVAAFKGDIGLREVWGTMLGGIGGDLKAFGRQLTPALIQSAGLFKRAWHEATTYVRNLFGDLGSTIIPLTEGLIGMLRHAAPGMKEAFATAVPVLKELARMLPTLGDGISSFFSSISDSESAMKGIRFLVLALSGSLMILGKVIQGLSAWFNFWTTAAEKVYSALAKIPMLGKPFEMLAEALHAINTPAKESGGALRSLNAEQHATAAASARAADEMRKLSTRMSELIGHAMGVDQAMLAWEEAIDAVTESVRDNGRTLDINTEKGRANVTAVLAAVQAAAQLREATIEAAGGQEASAQAVAAANAKYYQQIAALQATMRAAGLTQAQIDALLGKYRQMALQPDVRKTFTVEYRTVGDIPRDQRVGTGRIRGYASGTRSAPRGWALVGEQGPELMRLKGGEQILNARESARVMAGSRTAAGGRAGAGSAAQQMYLSLSARPGVGNDLLNAFIRGLSVRARRAGGIDTLLAGVT